MWSVLVDENGQARSYTTVLPDSIPKGWTAQDLTDEEGEALQHGLRRWNDLTLSFEDVPQPDPVGDLMAAIKTNPDYQAVVASLSDIQIATLEGAITGAVDTKLVDLGVKQEAVDAGGIDAIPIGP